MRTLSLTLVTCLLLLVAACNNRPAADYSTPEKSLATLIRAGNDKDVEAYADCFVKAEHAGMLEINLDSPYDEVRPGRVVEEGGLTVGFEEYYMDGKKVGEQPIGFVQEDGQWKASWAKAAEYRKAHPDKYN